MNLNVTVRRLRGEELRNAMSALADLRIVVFRDFPYLYEGSLDYEKKYLETYIKSGRAVIIAAFDGDEIVGASTALPLSDEVAEVQKPFIETGISLESVFYFGESVLRKDYRGLGIGHQFFELREAAALEESRCTHACFCAVDRSMNHPKWPQGYRPLDEFWSKRGYRQQPQMNTEFVWKELGEPQESPKKMNFWMKELR